MLLPPLTETDPGIVFGPETVSEARARFPRGLIQPPGSYRFGLDALLLAAYASQFIKSHAVVAELGSGCGASLFALALCSEISGAGFDNAAELIRAASQNAALLGLSERIDFIETDIGAITSDYYAKFHLILANPPWRKGRRPSSRLRRQALSLKPETLNLFCACASKLLHNRGLFCIILPPALLCELALAIQPLQLGLRQILPISSYCDKPAKRALCLLQKNAASDPVLLPALVLLESTPAGPIWTTAARNFCPFAYGR